MPAKTKDEKYNKIKDKKINTDLNNLCAGFPKQFIEYVEYTRGVDFEEEPDYERMKELFNTMFNEAGFDMDYKYDWLPIMV